MTLPDFDSEPECLSELIADDIRPLKLTQDGLEWHIVRAGFSM